MPTQAFAAAALAFLAAGSLALPAPPLETPAAAVPMQGDHDHPVWEALRAQGLSPPQWASLMLADADGNGRTDFLDLTATLAAAGGWSGLPVEVLAYGPVDARGAWASLDPEAYDFPELGATFLRLPLGGLDAIEGADLVVWEPRAFPTNTNPAGGVPANMRQNHMAQAGTAWSAAPTAWNGNGVRIAVLDTGADATHESLDGGKVALWKNCVSNVAGPFDDHGHGTHVASIAAGDDGTDFKGVAPGASLTIVKVLTPTGGSLAQFDCGVDYVLSGGAGGAATADVATMSAGLGVPPLAVTTLNGGEFDLFGWDRVADDIPAGDIPFTIAAGNHIGLLFENLGIDETLHAGVNGYNQVSSPAFDADVIAVGAVDLVQAPAVFTAVGPGPFLSTKPDVVAMGVDTFGAEAGDADDYIQLDGTSMATPVAAGVVALLVDKNGGLDNTAYESALRNGAKSACLVASTTSYPNCFHTALKEPVRPNFTDGWGVVKAGDSLALVPLPP